MGVWHLSSRRSALEEHVRSRYGQADKGRPGCLRRPYDEVLSRGRVKVRRWMKSQSLNEFAGAELGLTALALARYSPSTLALAVVRGGSFKARNARERVRDHYTEFAPKFAYITRSAMESRVAAMGRG